MSYPRLDPTGLTTLLTRLAAVIKQGHTVVNSSGTAMTQRSKLKFANATLTDDPTNDLTLVEVSGGGGSSNVDVMSASDVADIKNAVTIDCMDAVEVMTSSDVEDIKSAFSVTALDASDIPLSEPLHIGGGTQYTVEDALIALADAVEGI